MPLSEVALFRQSNLIRQVVSVAHRDGRDGKFTLKVRVELVNGWSMDFWERVVPPSRRYSFHVFEENQPIVRLDNAPHYRHLSTFPHHKHVGEGVEDSEEMDVSKVLIELEGMM